MHVRASNDMSVMQAQLAEFWRECALLDRVGRHPNVVYVAVTRASSCVCCSSFIGACIKPPNICLVTEWMPRGSVYDVLIKQQRFREPADLGVVLQMYVCPPWSH